MPGSAPTAERTNMAVSFCQQCSIEILDGDYGDLAGLVTEDDAAKGLGKRVLCQGCGDAFVDHLGRCHSHRCAKRHGSAAAP